MACGCATGKLSPAQQIASAPDPVTLRAFDGATRAPISWFAVQLRVAQSDAIFVGETHDDASAHRVEQGLVDGFLLAHPKGAVSFEMLERNEQTKVDAYLKGELTQDAFIDQTGSRDWAGEGSWMPWYQPMIESAKLAGSPVIAANAPREYVSQAMRAGYDPLLLLDAAERASFEIDRTLTRDGDWDRLKELMTELHQERVAEGGVGPAEPSDDAVDRVHRSQRVWDLTMGTSAAAALDRAPAVIHIAGGFHLEKRLGTVAQFARLRPIAKVLVIRLQPSEASELSETEVMGADIVIHTRRAASK